MAGNDHLTVFICSRETTCTECGIGIDKGDFIFISPDSKHLCLSCADLDHLVFLPSGDAALSRRAGKYSTLKAVVYKFSSSRKRNERQGALVEQSALERAEEECLSDEASRQQRRLRDAERRDRLDQQYVQEFAAKIRDLYPRCPEGREVEIAEHACLKYSGRVGRSASAKNLDREAVDLAVIAHIRHRETPYDEFLMSVDREQARQIVKEKIVEVRESWT